MTCAFRWTAASRAFLRPLATAIIAVVAASWAAAQPDPFGPFPGRAFRGTRPPRPTVQPGEEARVEEEIEGAVCVAILNLDRSTLGALVEARLRDKKMVNWWPRSATSQLLAEAQLHTAIDLPAAPNVEQGDKPPLPDALILLRTWASADGNQAEVVVCEPGLGLRLGVKRLALTGEPAKDVQALADAATTGLKKLGEKMRQLWAVPPFRSGDLVTTGNDLRSTLAREVEQALLSQQGSFAVELQYAHAIAAARVIAGMENGVTRPVPRFVLGEYRHEKESDSLAISLTIHESDTPGEPRQLPAAAGEAAVQSLLTALTAIAKSTGELQPADGGTAEKNLIAAVSRAYQKEGNWEAALALAESRLLLEPADRQWRSQAIGHAVKLVREQVEGLRRREAPAGLTDSPPTPSVGGLNVRPLPPEYVQPVTETLNTYRRALHHFQHQLSTVPPPQSRGTYAWIPSPGHDFVYAQLALPPAVSHSGDLVAIVSELRRQRQSLILRYNEIAAANGEAGDMIVFSELMPDERLALVARMIVDFRLYPRAEMRNQTYVGAALNYQGGREHAEKFLAQLATLPDPTVQKAVEQHRQRLGRQTATRPPAAAVVPRPEPAPDKPDPDAQIVFAPLTLPWKNIADAGSSARAACELYLPLGKAGDLFCYRGQVLLSRKKGEYKLIWEGGANLMFRHMTGAGYGPSLACFDGKYAWVPLVDPGKPARLLVIDPATEKVSEVTAKEGLPGDPAAAAHPLLAATALAKGKVFLAGSFGRTWLGVATFDPEKGGAVKVVHEARDLPVSGERDQHLSPTLAFDPTWLFTLSGKSEGGQPLERVLVGRYASGTNALPFPLVVEPQSGKAEVLATPLAGSGELRPMEHGGAVYWAIPWSMAAAGGQEVWRLSLPELKPQSLVKIPLTDRSQFATLAVEESRVHLVAQQWRTAASWDETLTPLVGKLPGQPYGRRLPLRSELHGWLLLNTNESQIHAVEFKKR